MVAQIRLGLLSLILAAGPVAVAEARVEAEAIPGRPFGVARITVTGLAGPVDPHALFVQEPSGRVFYPFFAVGRAGEIVGGLLGVDIDLPRSLTVFFLFSGEEPLTLNIPGVARDVVVTPRRRTARAQQRLTLRWWRAFQDSARQLQSSGDYPPLVETYLTSMLAQRMGLGQRQVNRLLDQRDTSPAQQTFQLLMGTERLRAETMRETMLGRSLSDSATLPLPDEVQWRPLSTPRLSEEIEVEPIAMHVPVDCFYVRFGSFQNYLWLSHLLDDYGGDIASMVTLRGYRSHGDERSETQLALEESALADLLGGAVIADVAIIGRDMYTEEGGAVGMLFQERNALLARDIRQQRAAALRREKDHGAEETIVKIAGRDVGFLSTPDNRLRSFYAVDGKFHLVTSSRAIVEGFFAAGAGEGALGASDEFRYARSVLPVSRQDTIFAYLSSAFLRGLVSPQYQIELRRRIEAVTDIELVHMARWAARAEGQPADTIEDLVQGGFLPPGFGRRADGSGPILEPDRVLDSLRGARRTFTPIPDVPLTAVTHREAERYARRAAYYQANWQKLDPLMVAVKRYALNGQRMERVVVDAYVTPLHERKYGWLASILGPPTRQRISSAPGDIVSVQAVLQGGLLQLAPHHLFVGIQDIEPPSQLQPLGVLRILRILQSTPGYLGAWPKPGFLDLLPVELGGGPPDALGYSLLPLGLWRRQWEAFSVLSFQRPVLDAVTPHLQVQETDLPAQVRIRVGDLSTAKLRQLVNTLNYARAYRASLGNTQLLHSLMRHFKIAPEEALAKAQQLFDADLICTLRGKYELVQHDNGVKLWQSTAWPNDGQLHLPEDYQAPLLQWFRGVDANLSKYPNRLVAHAELDMQRKAGLPRIQLPLFNNFFNNKNKNKNKGKEPDAAPDKPSSDEPVKTPQPEDRRRQQF